MGFLFIFLLKYIYSRGTIETSLCWFLQIMKHFSAAPMDQHIWVNGEELKGNDRRLGELGVTPGAILMLKVLYR